MIILQQFMQRHDQSADFRRQRALSGQRFSGFAALLGRCAIGRSAVTPERHGRAPDPSVGNARIVASTTRPVTINASACPIAVVATARHSASRRSAAVTCDLHSVTIRSSVAFGTSAPRRMAVMTPVRITKAPP
jgi:hypothetical protein